MSIACRETPPFPQRGHADLEGVDAEEKVLTEMPLGDHGPQVAVGGAKHPHIGLDGTGLSQPADLARFEETQQFHLDVAVELA